MIENFKLIKIVSAILESRYKDRLMKLFCEKPESKGYFISKNSIFAIQRSKELLYRIQLLDKLQPNQFPSHFEIQFEVLL